jgi:hypothetical protein
MSFYRSCRLLSRQPLSQATYHARTVQRRGFATPTESANLPLAGIKVLDMTRVLAGVSLDFCTRQTYHILTIIKPYCTQILGDLGYER